MTINLLISCMHEKDTSIIQRSNVQSDVVVVNQCDHDSVEEFDFTNKKGQPCHAKFICTTERGLSRSRNMAIRNAWGDVCLICDDDELFADNYEEIITNAYKEIGSDLVIFGFHYTNRGRNNFSSRTKVGWLNFLKICSVQISFKREAILANEIVFATNLGSGSGNGGGEENKFISDCLRKKLRIVAEPSDIAVINYDPENSNWFKGYDKDYFFKKGWGIKQSLGVLGSIAFALTLCMRRYKTFKKDINPFVALYYMLKGIFSR